MDLSDIPVKKAPPILKESESAKKFPYWHWSQEELFKNLESRKEGLTSVEAGERLNKWGYNTLTPPKRWKNLVLFFSQFKSPVILLLIAAAILSFFLGDRTDSTIICAIVALSGLLGFFQERGAINALEKMLQIVETKVNVLRDGKEVEVPSKEIVPGDIIRLGAGDLVPADSILLEANHFFVDESTLTGESLPAGKAPGILPENTPSPKKSNFLFLGTMVKSGIATAIVAATGRHSEFGHITEKIKFHPPTTAFEKGVAKFGYFLMALTIVLVVIIFTGNVLLHKPFLSSLLFSLAIAVGLTPQLLPAIISVNLSHGARRMAKKHVIVKRLPSIENFGQMDILCTDKTGTITQGTIKFDRIASIDGKENGKAVLYALLNAHFQAGYTNPLDKALMEGIKADLNGWKKISEMPYDFARKRISLVCEKEGKQLLLAKGAFAQLLPLCDRAEFSDGKIVPINECKEGIEKHFHEEGVKGFRTLAIAYGEGKEEKNLIFLGFIHFFDPIKPGIQGIVSDMKRRGILLKLITGDNRQVANFVAGAIGVPPSAMALGEEIQKMNDQDLLKIAGEKNIFAEIEPEQKERIILALRKNGHIVGYLGDGVNDVNALHNADVSIAVDSGADAAKEAADIVLLQKDLKVLREGVEAGRHTFINTMKYVYMATSANFGNMFTMAGASLFLSFLPMLPKQVLLTNFFSDLPEMALATDHVDPDAIESPVKWDLPFIRKFMLVFGLLNSASDCMTFAILLFWMKADVDLFRTAWFFENVTTAALIVLVIRTRHLFFRSKPSKLLAIAVFGVTFGIFLLPYTALGKIFALVPLPPIFYLFLIGVNAFFILSVEIAKYFFFRRRKKA